MADLEKTIRIVLLGDDQVGKTISGVSSGLDKLGSKAVNATQPLADLAENAIKLEAALGALAIAGLAAAIREAGKFSDSVNEISTLFSETPENVDKFKRDIIEYAQSSTSSIEDINEAIYNAISAGIDYRDSIDFIKTAEELATAGRAGLNSTTEALVGTLNAYGESMDSAQGYSDALFTAVAKGKTTIPELNESLSQITPIAAGLGVPFDTILAAISGLTAYGVPTSQAITQIRGALVAFSKPSKEASEIAESLGINFSAAAVETEGFDVVMKKVYDAAEGDVATLSKLYGRVEALAGGLALGADEGGKFKDALDAMESKTGATAEAFGKMSDNLDQVYQTLKNNLTAVLIDFGTPLLNETTDVMGAISEAFQSVSFSFQSGAFDPIIDMIESFGAGLAQTISDIAQILPEALENVDYTGLIKSIEGLGGEIGDLFDAFFGEIDLTTTEGLTAAIQKGIDSLSGLTNVVSGILDSWEPIIRFISEAIDKFSDADSDVQELIGNILGWSQIINDVARNLGIITTAIGAIGTALSVMATTNLVKTIAQFQGFAKVVGTTALGLGQFLAVLAAPVVGWALGTWLRDNFEIVKDFGDALGELAFDIVNFGDDSVEAAEKQAAHTEALGAAAVAMVEAKEAAGELPSQTTTEVKVDGADTYEEEFNALLMTIQELPAEKTTSVEAEIDTDSIQRVKDAIEVDLPADTEAVIDIEIDDASIVEAKAEIETLPSEKLLEIKLQGEIDIELAKIKAQAETIQTSLEWEAKVDIAEIEAMADTVIALSGDISTMFTSTGDVIGDLVGSLSGLSASEFLDVTRWIEEENARRDQLLALETDLTKAQVEYLKARTASLQGGGGLIQIQGDNLEPELQLVLSRIIELTQITANEQGLEFLIGV